MQSTYSSPSFTTDDDLQIYCFCNKLVTRRVAGPNARNPGKVFYSCCNDSDRKCNFFKWENEIAIFGNSGNYRNDDNRRNHNTYQQQQQQQPQQQRFSNGTFGTNYIPTSNTFPNFPTLNDNSPTRISNNNNNNNSPPPIYNSPIHSSHTSNSFPSCSTLNKPKSNTFETIDNIHSINNKLEQQLKAQKKRVDFLLKDRKMFQDENSELKGHIQSLEYENNQMISQIGLESSNREIEDLNQQLEDLKIRNTELQMNLENINNDLTRDQEIKSLKQKIKLLENNTTSLTNSSEEVTKLKSELELSHQKITNYERKIETLIKSNKDKELEIENQIKNSEKKYEDVLYQIEELKINYKNLEKHNLILAETNKILVSSLQQQKNETTYVSSSFEVDDLKYKIEKLKIENENLKQEPEILRKEKEFLEKKVKALEEDLEEKQRE
ncbi:hypothetical protein Glove_406g89 [Diversispora epigaea]|uniref:GRF-type domain-containing protein n=1 Tax=Diversispora epigaea TaxID=1348612 RepID=A0A397H0A3_9GLOM|nr:hypothetical protein Glove_406g89 [Diversispora epigaea]